MGKQGHSFSSSGPTLPVNNRFIFSLKTIKLQAMRLCHTNNFNLRICLLSFVETPRKFIIAELSIRAIMITMITIFISAIMITMYSPCKRTRNVQLI